MARKNEDAAPRRALPEETGAEPEPERLTFGQHVVAFLKELTAVVVGAVVVASLLRGFVGQMFLIPSVSMENTLRVSDRVVVEKLSTIKGIISTATHFRLKGYKENGVTLHREEREERLAVSP